MRHLIIKVLARVMLYLISREEREYTRVWHELGSHAFMALYEGEIPCEERMTYHLERNPRRDALIMERVFPRGFVFKGEYHEANG